METKKQENDDGLMRYRDFRPTGFDFHIEVEDRENWIVAPVNQTRDSGPLDRSNFRVVLADLGGEGEQVEVHRFGHWGPGWFELILVHPDLADKVYDWSRALADYPVADKEDWANEEFEDFCQSWENWGRHDYCCGLQYEVSDNSALEYLIDELDLDQLWEQARDYLSWEYLDEGSGVTINIDGGVRETIKRGILAQAICNYIRKGVKS